MQPFFIEGTKSSPAVDFDPTQNRLTMIGQSYPENPFKFYEPILEWLDGYLEYLTTDAVFEFKIPYMNTSSTKCLMMVLDKLESAHLQGKRVFVRWTCNRDNESEFECAEELKEDLSLPFEIIAAEEDR